MTEKLYNKDQYIKKFTAEVVSCEKCDKGFLVVLDKTAFFPEEGGQPCDTGFLNQAEVLDVQERDGVIYHTVSSPFETGESVEGELEFEGRFLRMQSHAAEHLLSGIVNSLYGYNNVGFHMADNLLMTVDFDGVLTEEQLEKVELLANRAIYKNVPITVSYPTPEEFSTLDCRSKIEAREGIRVVTIEGFDTCACCAPHPATTGEIGVLKVLSHIGYKGGVRLEMVAGERAFSDYAYLNSTNKRLMAHLSAKRLETETAVLKLSESLSALRGEVARLSGRLALSELSPVFTNGSAWALLKGASYDAMRLCSNRLTDNGALTSVILSETDEGFLYTVSSPEGDTRELVKALNSTFDGRGGGKPVFAQGKVMKGDEDAFRHFFEENL